jgi:hypothetical protein
VSSIRIGAAKHSFSAAFKLHVDAGVQVVVYEVVVYEVGRLTASSLGHCRESSSPCLAFVEQSKGISDAQLLAPMPNYEIKQHTAMPGLPPPSGWLA